MEMPKVIKIGNSKGLTIPHRFCKKLGIEIGQRLECRINIDNDIIIKLPHHVKERS